MSATGSIDIAAIREAVNQLLPHVGDGDQAREARENMQLVLATLEYPNMMTGDQYVEASGVCCPACRSADIIGAGPFDTPTAGEATQDCTCNNCGTCWTDIYKLTGYASQ